MHGYGDMLASSRSRANAFKESAQSIASDATVSAHRREHPRVTVLAPSSVLASLVDRALVAFHATTLRAHIAVRVRSASAQAIAATWLSDDRRGHAVRVRWPTFRNVTIGVDISCHAKTLRARKRCGIAQDDVFETPIVSGDLRLVLVRRNVYDRKLGKCVLVRSLDAMIVDAIGRANSNLEGGSLGSSIGHAVSSPV